jgi:hypothetical protein
MYKKLVKQIVWNFHKPVPLMNLFSKKYNLAIHFEGINTTKLQSLSLNNITFIKHMKSRSEA